MILLISVGALSVIIPLEWICLKFFFKEIYHRLKFVCALSSAIRSDGNTAPPGNSLDSMRRRYIVHLASRKLLIAVR